LRTLGGIVLALSYLASVAWAASPQSQSATRPREASLGAAVSWVLSNRDDKGFVIYSFNPALNRLRSGETFYVLRPLTAWVLCAACKPPASAADVSRILAALR